ncbi:MAG: SatD family protein, partial [Candidatus Thermoplasmatota archaeon]|nr:SatD family protein [Candidatus Thermoplasmatota archaeon]
MVSPHAYVALIGDIRASRELEDRRGVQERLETALSEVNQRAGPALAARMVITAGDEFQGLFHGEAAAANALAAMHHVANALHPVELAFGLGLGSLETALKAEAVGMDGPCFHRAREALEQRAKGRDRWAAVEGFQKVTATANHLLTLCGALRRGWTSRQLEFIRALEAPDAPTQKAVAQAMDVSPSVVSESLKAAHYRE